MNNLHISMNEHNQPYISNDPEQDWRTAAHVLATALNNFSPQQWLLESNSDVVKFVQNILHWHSNYLVPHMAYFNQVKSTYSTQLDSPF